MGARIKGAARVIAVEPVRYRRELALELGATVALDPNAEGDGLVGRVQELCATPTRRRLAGGGYRGPDYVIEAVGGACSRPRSKRDRTPRASGRWSRHGNSALRPGTW